MRRGQLLLEVVLAAGVAMVALLALTQVSTRSISTAGFSESKSEATALATAGVEGVRAWKRQHTWAEFSALAVASPGRLYCLNTLPASTAAWPAVGGCAAGNTISNKYTRQATMILIPNPPFPDKVELVMEVKWDDAVGQTSRTFTSKQVVNFTKY